MLKKAEGLNLLLFLRSNKQIRTKGDKFIDKLNNINNENDKNSRHWYYGIDAGHR